MKTLTIDCEPCAGSGRMNGNELGTFTVRCVECGGSGRKRCGICREPAEGLDEDGNPACGACLALDTAAPAAQTREES